MLRRIAQHLPGSWAWSITFRTLPLAAPGPLVVGKGLMVLARLALLPAIPVARDRRLALLLRRSGHRLARRGASAG